MANDAAQRSEPAGDANPRGADPDPEAAEAHKASRASVPRRWVTALVATFVVAALAIALLTQPSVRRQVMLSISRRPTPFTELYFTDYDGLPKNLPAGGAETIGFAVANHESGDRDYNVV